MSSAEDRNEQAVCGCCRYFEEDDEESTPALAYIPAPGSPTQVPEPQETPDDVNEDEDDDPLDAYMAGIEQQVYTIQFISQIIFKMDIYIYMYN